MLWGLCCLFLCILRRVFGLNVAKLLHNGAMYFKKLGIAFIKSESCALHLLLVLIKLAAIIVGIFWTCTSLPVDYIFIVASDDRLTLRHHLQLALCRALVQLDNRIHVCAQRVTSLSFRRLISSLVVFCHRFFFVCLERYLASLSSQWTNDDLLLETYRSLIAIFLFHNTIRAYSI